jgi:hypothetical protein
MKVLTDEKRGNPLIQCPLNLHFLAAWIKFDILFTIILIKRKSTDQRKTFISAYYQILNMRNKMGAISRAGTAYNS